MRMVKDQKERKKEILQAAKEVFLAKGFEKATMEEIIEKTSLSKGGVYYYYANTIDLLHALMVEGIRYRARIIQTAEKYREKAAGQGSYAQADWQAEMLVEKMLDDTDLMRLYVIYLQAAERNPALRALFEELKKENRALMREILGPQSEVWSDPFYSDFMIAFMNSIMLGAQVLHARESFRAHRSLIKGMVLLALKERTREGRDP